MTGSRLRVLSRIPVGFRYMAAGAFSFSVMSALVKHGGSRIPTMEIVLARSVVVTALAWGTLRVQGADPRGNERGLLLLRGVLGFIALSCFYSGVVHLPLADATVIQYTNPVWTTLIAAVALGEVLRRREVALVLASLLGVVLVARPTFLFGDGGRGLGLDPLWVGVALCGAVFSAAAYVTVRRLRAERAMVIVFWFSAVSIVGAVPFVVPVWVTPSAGEWLLLLAIGLTTHLGQVFITWGLQREAAGRATAVAYLQIVFAGVWGFLFFSERPDAWSVGGALTVMAATFLLARGRGSGGREPA